MKVLIFGGAGRQGRIVKSVLEHLSCEVITADAEGADWNVPLQEADKINTLMQTVKPDCVVSSLPYHLNWQVFREANAFETPYIDLGGSTSVAERIKLSDACAPILTDMGLAPGLVNMWAEEQYRDMTEIGRSVKRVNMMVGGLPEEKGLGDKILHYAPTWSIEGLINQYMSPCRVVVNNAELVNTALSSRIPLSDGYEAFNTSGGIGHTAQLMVDRGVDYCSYKTIRYAGHCERLKALIQLPHSGPQNVLRDYLTKISKEYGQVPDKVVIRCESETYTGNFYTKHRIIRATGEWSAMQLATGIPVAVSAYVLMTKELESKHMTYHDLIEAMPDFNQKVDNILRVYGGIGWE